MNEPDSAGERGRSRDAVEEWAEFERLLAAESSRRAKSDELSTLEADALSEAAAQPPAAVARVPSTRSSPVMPEQGRAHPHAVYDSAGDRAARKHRWRQRFGLGAWSPKIWVVAALAFALGFAASRALQGPGHGPSAAAAGVASETPRGVDQTEPSEDQATPALKLDRNPAALAPDAGAAAPRRTGAGSVTGSAGKR